MEVTIKDRQTMLDVQIIACGSLEGVIKTSALNGIAVTDDLTDGQTLQVADVVLPSIAKIYANRGYSPATAIDDSAGNVRVGGIGYMAVDIDFIVS